MTTFLPLKNGFTLRTANVMLRYLLLFLFKLLRNIAILRQESGISGGQILYRDFSNIVGCLYGISVFVAVVSVFL